MIIVHIFNTSNSNKEWDWDEDFCDPFLSQVSSREYISAVGNDYSNYITHMEEHDLIVSDHYHRSQLRADKLNKEAKEKGYRQKYKPKYISYGFSENYHGMLSDYRYYIRTRRRKYINYFTFKNGIRPYKDFFNNRLNAFYIPIELVERYIQSELLKPENQMLKGTIRTLKNGKKVDAYDFLVKKFDGELMKCRKINEGMIYSKVKTYGRQFTNYTSLMSVIRKMVFTRTGERMIEIDINSSQVHFLLKLLNTEYEKGTYNPYIEREFDKLADVLDENTISIPCIDPDEGFYHCIGRKAFGITCKLTKQQKKELKQKVKNGDDGFWYFLFGPHKKPCIFDDVFKKEFPNLYQMILDYKFGSKGKGGYKRLSRDLQLAESSVVLKQFCTEVIRLYPDMPMFSVHDCISVPESRVQEIKILFEKVLNDNGIITGLSVGG